MLFVEEYSYLTENSFPDQLCRRVTERLGSKTRTANLTKTLQTLNKEDKSCTEQGG